MPESALTMEVEGVDKIMSIFKKYFNDIDTSSIIINALNMVGKEIEAKAKDILNEKIYNMPERGYLRTGLLRARTTSDAPTNKSGEVNVVIRSRQYYATYIELGTDKMPPRAFMLPAAQAKKGDVLSILDDALTNFLKSKL